ncbi:MAG: exopolyphosphatase, partial [Pseudomonadota bacterium]
AEVLGRALRFGAMLWNKPDEDFGRLKWSPRKDKVSLYLSQKETALYGEVAEARFLSLADSLNATPEVKILRPRRAQETS